MKAEASCCWLPLEVIVLHGSATDLAGTVLNPPLACTIKGAASIDLPLPPAMMAAAGSSTPCSPPLPKWRTTSGARLGLHKANAPPLGQPVMVRSGASTESTPRPDQLASSMMKGLGLVSTSRITPIATRSRVASASGRLTFRPCARASSLVRKMLGQGIDQSMWSAVTR